MEVGILNPPLLLIIFSFKAAYNIMKNSINTYATTLNARCLHWLLSHLLDSLTANN